MSAALDIAGLDKDFLRHLHGGVRLAVLRGETVSVAAGECVALAGPSGAGKSTLLRCLYGTYRPGAGRIVVAHRGGMVELATADERMILQLRDESIGYVSQFLRAVPRVAAIEVVAEAGRDAEAGARRARAADLLHRLGIPARLHGLPPATFSGGEQQRVNLARGFIGGHPILLLDEPTAALDAANAAIVVEMIREAKAGGVAVVGIFHDEAVRDAVADRLHAVTPLQDTPRTP